MFILGRISIVGGAVLMLAGCAIPKPHEYSGAGYGVPKGQAWQQCRHEIQRDLNRAGTLGTVSDGLVFAGLASDQMDSCMAAKGYHK